MNKDRVYRPKLSDIGKDFFIRCDYAHFANMEAFLEGLKGVRLRKFKEILTLLETGKSIKQEDYAPLATSYIHLVPRDVKDGELNLRAPIFLTEEKGKELSEFSVKEGDILMVISSNVGDAVLFDLDDEKQYTISHYMVRMQIDETQYDPEFLVYYLNHPTTKLFFRATETGKTQKNLSKTYIYNMLIPSISRSKQQGIMEDISKKLLRKNQLRHEIKKLSTQSDEEFWRKLT